MSGYYSSPFDRRGSVAVPVGGVNVGGDSPIVVQSMTNTDTADVDSTVAQVAALHKAGSELVRITVDRDESAAAVPKIRDRLERLGVDVPLIGDFHYIGHKLLADHPACAEALAKYRINPGNVGFGKKRDAQFRFPTSISFDNDGSEIYTMIEVDTRDRPGLLFDLTSALAGANIYIASAVIATYGHQVVDTFYVKDMFGLKIRSAQKQETLKKKLLSAIAAGAERAKDA